MLLSIRDISIMSDTTSLLNRLISSLLTSYLYQGANIVYISTCYIYALTNEYTVIEGRMYAYRNLGSDENTTHHSVSLKY